MDDAWTITAKVSIRRGGGWSVKPEAEAVDGKCHRFTRGWTITDEDSSIYVGETAWIADREGWPAEAPIWIASGDLTECRRTASPTTEAGE